MKKTLILAAIFIAMASFGGKMTLSAHAQALTPAQLAADQQELAVLKAQLVNLQMQEGQVPVGDAGAPTVVPAPQVGSTVSPQTTQTSMPTSMMLSASDVSAINTALTSLKGALVALEADVANNPNIVTTNGQGVANVLGGIDNTLASIGDELQNGSIAMTQPSTVSPSTSGSTGTGIAQSNPSTAATAPTTNQTAPAATAPSAAATTPAPTAAITPPANTAPQTAQAASTFSASKLNWPLIIVIILIVAAIAIWLWWDDSEEPKAKPIVKNVSSAPQKSAPVVQMNSTTTTTRSTTSTQTTTPSTPSVPSAQPTPMSSVVSQQQTRKPA